MSFIEPFIFNVAVSEDVSTLPKEKAINEKAVTVSLEVSPAARELFHKFGFKQRGSKAWSHATADRSDLNEVRRWFKAYIENFTPGTLFEPTATAVPVSGTIIYPSFSLRDHSSMDKLGFGHSIFRPTNWATTLNQIADNRFIEFRPAHLSAEAVERLTAYCTKVNDYAVARRAWAHDTIFNNTFFVPAGFTVDIVNGTIWVRALPSQRLKEDNVEELLKDYVDFFPTLSANRKYLTPMVAHEIIEHLKLYVPGVNAGRLISGSETVFDLIDFASRNVTVTSIPGRPADTTVSVGANAETLRLNNRVTVGRGDTAEVPLTTVLNYEGRELFIHPSVVDVANMAKAKPYRKDARLKPYQKEAVGLHLSTSLGYVQACAPGMGKTVVQLTAMRARAEKTVGYRGLIVCENNLREQWTEEAAVWFPEATVVTVFDDKVATKKALLKAMVSDEPVVVVLAYSFLLKILAVHTARKEAVQNLEGLSPRALAVALNSFTHPVTTASSILVDTQWNDIAADEATVIRNGSSKQSEAMWVLRANAEIAVPLIGTPINREVADLFRLVSWARGDRRMFSGVKAEELYDLETAEGATELFRSFGPLLFRRDTSEVADEMPDVDEGGGKAILLTPSDAELALAEAAERELRRCYFELLAALEEVDTTGVDSADLEQAKNDLRDARGAWLGGTQLARMATSDPAALNSSESVGAALLKAQGLVEAALVDTPTKRARLLEDIQKRVLEGERVLVFTEFSTVADVLVPFLQENGIRAEAYTGGAKAKNRDAHRVAFQNGDIDVLICTRAGERGLTLHRANAIYNYDSPWALERLIQRTGRAMRIGSKNKKVDILYLILEGTIDQRVAETVVKVGSLASMVLDNSRGVDVAKTETGNTISGLVKAVGKGGSSTKSILAMGELLWGKQAA